MIAFLRGNTRTISETTVLILSSEGIGYEVTTNGAVTPEVIQKVGLCIWHTFRSNGEQELFGFTNPQARGLAQQLAAKVNGVGPVMASRIVQLVSLDGLGAAAKLGAEDGAAAIRKLVARLPIKKAKEIVTYLRESWKVPDESGDSMYGTVSSTLKALGHKVDMRELQQLIENSPGMTAEQLVKRYLDR